MDIESRYFAFPELGVFQAVVARFFDPLGYRVRHELSDTFWMARCPTSIAVGSADAETLKSVYRAMGGKRIPRVVFLREDDDPALLRKRAFVIRREGRSYLVINPWLYFPAQGCWTATQKEQLADGLNFELLIWLLYLRQRKTNPLLCIFEWMVHAAWNLCVHMIEQCKGEEMDREEFRRKAEALYRERFNLRWRRVGVDLSKYTNLPRCIDIAVTGL